MTASATAAAKSDRCKGLGHAARCQWEPQEEPRLRTMRLGVHMADGHSIVNFRMVSSLVVQKGTDQLVIGTCR